MEITSLASSSKGNCYLVNDRKTNLMIEVGISLKQIREKGINPTTIDGLLISHEHKDHCKFWYQLAPYTTIYTSCGTFEALENKDLLNADKVKIVSAEKSFKIGSFIVYAFRTEHDAKEPFGFYMYSQYSKETLLFATDTYYINNRFDNLQYIMIECNYKKEYLDANENLPKSARIRLLKSHFELSHVCDFLKANDLSKVKEIYLMHLSAGNSNADEFKKTIQELTGIPTYIFNE